MIRLTKITKHDFLSPEWIQKFKEVNVPMNDATYHLLLIDGTWYVCPLEDVNLILLRNKPQEQLPTYTLPQLLFKLDEWHPEYKGLIMWKDAPFYFAQYSDAPDNSPFSCYRETPIESAAQLLINCMKEKFGCVCNIGGKYGF